MGQDTGKNVWGISSVLLIYGIITLVMNLDTYHPSAVVVGRIAGYLLDPAAWLIYYFTQKLFSNCEQFCKHFVSTAASLTIHTVLILLIRSL